MDDALYAVTDCTYDEKSNLVEIQIWVFDENNYNTRHSFIYVNYPDDNYTYDLVNDDIVKDATTGILCDRATQYMVRTWNWATQAYTYNVYVGYQNQPEPLTEYIRPFISNCSKAFCTVLGLTPASTATSRTDISLSFALISPEAIKTLNCSQICGHIGRFRSSFHTIRTLPFFKLYYCTIKIIHF